MHIVYMAKIRETAKVRPAGYLEDVLAAGELVDGDRIVFTPAAFAALHRKYSPPGLGDRLAKAAKPIAEGLDSVFGTNLADCDGCQQRQDALNRAFPSV